MQADLKKIESKGFYFLRDTKYLSQNDCLGAYCRSTYRRFFSPGAASSAFVARYFNAGGKLESQYVYGSIYDAVRQISSYKEDEFDGVIELGIYTDDSGLNIIRTWEFEMEGYKDTDGYTVVENCGWVEV